MNWSAWKELGNLVVGHMPEKFYFILEGIFLHQVSKKVALWTVPGQGKVEVHPLLRKYPASGQEHRKTLFFHQTPQGQKLIGRRNVTGFSGRRRQGRAISDMDNFRGGLREQVR
jgi:hypothetical protein